MCLKKLFGAVFRGSLSLTFFQSTSGCGLKHERSQLPSERLTSLHGAIQLFPACISPWVLDTLSHFIIPIRQKAKQKLGVLDQLTRIALDLAVAALA